jgi:hypothetical protein
LLLSRQLDASERAFSLRILHLSGRYGAGKQRAGRQFIYRRRVPMF